jgi:hypothetical protein
MSYDHDVNPFYAFSPQKGDNRAIAAICFQIEARPGIEQEGMVLRARNYRQSLTYIQHRQR